MNDCADGEDVDRARQWLWRLRRAADGHSPSRASPTKLILADCGAAFSEPGREAFRNMAAASKAKGLAAITDVAMRRLFAPEFQAAASGPDGRPARGIPAHRPGRVPRRLRCAGRTRPAARIGKVKVPVLVLVGEHDEATPPPMSHEMAAGLPQARLEDHSGLRPRPATAIAHDVSRCDRRFSAGDQPCFCLSSTAVTQPKLVNLRDPP